MRFIYYLLVVCASVVLNPIYGQYSSGLADPAETLAAEIVDSEDEGFVGPAIRSGQERDDILMDYDFGIPRQDMGGARVENLIDSIISY